MSFLAIFGPSSGSGGQQLECVLQSRALQMTPFKRQIKPSALLALASTLSWGMSSCSTGFLTHPTKQLLRHAQRNESETTRGALSWFLLFLPRIRKERKNTRTHVHDDLATSKGPNLERTRHKFVDPYPCSVLCFALKLQELYSSCQ